MLDAKVSGEEAAKAMLKKWSKWIVVISILYFIWIGFVFVSIFVFGISYNWAILTFDLWVYVGLALFSFFIVVEVVLLVYYWSIVRKKAFRMPLFKPVKEEIKTEEVSEGKKIIIYTCPKEVEGGVYSSSYINISNDMTLKLRQMLVRICVLCGKRLECWPKYKDKVTRAEFLLNADCLDGLEHIGKRKAKKKR
jgi:hypothetical protein